MDLSEPKSVTVPEIALIAVRVGRLGLARACCSPESSNGKSEKCWAGRYFCQD